MNTSYKVLGIMSGTSLDGIDLAICTFQKKKKWQFRIKRAKTLKYSNYWTRTLKNLHLKNKSFIEEIDIKYAQFLAQKINKFLENEKVDFIACHGHTIFHNPQNNYTLQIGDGKTIANFTKIKTINNFRALDIALNGQGAPLVPIGDLHLFPEYKYCVNLGGFANISIKDNITITAFDICPVNIVMNEISKKLDLDFDIDGENAKRGKIIPQLLKKLNNIEFYKTPPPKSLSREWVDEYVKPLLLENYLPEDMLHTFCEHISIQIGSFLKTKNALFTGGGCFNSYLVKRIMYYSKAEIIIPSDKIINFKEALIFAFLGVLRLRNEINCLRSVTGALKDSCSGEINNPM